ncbi:MAG: DUF1552 domain-containing protein [Myxococcales bacterium]|nr:DUF1552 domain-containing protein [Myxococcales bacterium]
MSGLTRRAFLRGSAGLAVALPTLASLRPARAQATPQRRLVVVWETGGTLNHRTTEAHYDRMHPWDDWRPGGTPQAPVLGPLHQGLVHHRDRLLFLSGLDNQAEPQGHERADVSSLTARRAVERAGVVTGGGPSIDQVLAERLNAAHPVPFPRVDLALPGPHFGEPCYRAAGEPVQREADPRRAFARLFGHLDPDRSAEALAALRADQRSVLDGALGGLRALTPNLAPEDRRILDAHLTHLRAIERRLALLDGLEAAACAAPGLAGVDALGPVDAPGARALLGPLHAELAAHALACGLTHVVTLHAPDTIEPFLPTPFSDRFPQPDAHALGHVARELGDPQGERAQAWRAEMQANRAWKIGLVAGIMDGLAPFADAHGALLDQTLILHLSEFSNAADHTTRDLPVMLAGGLPGLAMGRHLTFSDGGRGDTLEGHVDYKADWSTHNLFATMLQAFGFEDEHFGDDQARMRGALPGVLSA